MAKLPDDMKIASCKICLLAKAMRDCKTCPFNIGLVYKTLDSVKVIEVEYPLPLMTARLESLKSLV